MFGADAGRGTWDRGVQLRAVLNRASGLAVGTRRLHTPTNLDSAVSMRLSA